MGRPSSHAGRRGCVLRGALAVIALAAIAGCSDSKSPYFGTTTRHASKDAATFYVNNGSEPEYLDPSMAHDSASTTLILQMFEGLTTYAHGTMHPVPAGALRWDQSDDNRIFRFHLRPEARWSDGKPVRAQDYEYAWKRALRPQTASQAASTLYPVKNAEAYNLGKLQVTRRDASLLGGPSEGAAAGEKLAKGQPVLRLARSPMKVATAVAPLAEAPAGATVELEKEADQLAFPGGKPPAKASADGGWKGAEVVVLRQGPAVECSGAPDHWYEIERAGKRGFLPGCALGGVKGPGFALVRKVSAIPTFTPGLVVDAQGGADAAADAAAPTGFVSEADLVDDDKVLGVRAVSDLLLEVELERPTPYFLDITSHPTLFPLRADVVEPFRERGEPDMWTRPESIVTNGPYILDEWRFRYEITMKRNPYFYDHDKLRIERIVWMEVEEYHATMNLYKAGDLDYLGDNLTLPQEYIPTVEKTKDFHRTFYLSTYWYELNTRVPPTDDVRVRRALNLGTDKQQLVERITRGGQIPASHYVPDYTGLGYEDAANADKKAGTDPFSKPDAIFNPELGRKLLGEAGFPVEKDGDVYRAKGFPSLEILYNTSEGHKSIAVAIQDMWKRHLGISVTLKNEEWKVMLKNVRDGNFQIARFGWVADFNHAHTWLDTFLSYSPNNRTGWVDKGFDAMVKKAAATSDPKESIRLYREAEAVAVQAMPKMPLYFYTKMSLVKPWVMGFKQNARNIQLVKWLWLEPGRHENPTDLSPAYPIADFPPFGHIAMAAPEAPPEGAPPVDAPPTPGAP